VSREQLCRQAGALTVVMVSLTCEEFGAVLLIERHGYPWVPTDQGPRGPCQVGPTCQKPCRPASGHRDLIHNPGDVGRPLTTISRLRKICWACGASFSLDRGGGAASRSEDRGILSVITEGDLPNL
jgi:hypothetical protein